MTHESILKSTHTYNEEYNEEKIIYFDSRICVREQTVDDL